MTTGVINKTNKSPKTYRRMAVVDGEAAAKPEMNLTYVCMSISRIAINGIRVDAIVCFTRHGKTFHISKNINSAIQKKKI